MSLYVSPVTRSTDTNGNPLNGARRYFYLTGTLTPASVYTTSDLSTAHASPVVADAGGLFAPIYLDPNVSYRVIDKDAAGNTIQDVDPVDQSEILRRQLSGAVTLSGTTSFTRALGETAGGTPVDWTVTFSGDSSGTASVYGEKHLTYASGANNISAIRTQYIGCEVDTSAGTAATAYGTHTYVWVKNAGSVTNARVVEAHLRNDGPGDITATGIWFNAASFTGSAGGTLQQAIGFNCSAVSDTTLIDRGYCFNADDQYVCTTASVGFRSALTADPKKWAFQSVGDAQSAHLGKFAFGKTTAPAEMIDVAGNIIATGSIKSSGSVIGYATGAGGAVTQATSKSTAVTLNKACGQIVTHNAALAAAAIVSFDVNNSLISGNEAIVLNLKGGQATVGTYRVWVDVIISGKFTVVIENRSAGSLSEALTLNFAVLSNVVS